MFIPRKKLDLAFDFVLLGLADEGKKSQNKKQDSEDYRAIEQNFFNPAARPVKFAPSSESFAQPASPALKQNKSD